MKETITGDELMAYVNADRNALPAAEKTEAVSYTHLDVYKRQTLTSVAFLPHMV